MTDKMNEQFIEHWRQVAEFDYPALQAELAASVKTTHAYYKSYELTLAERDKARVENERLIDMHRKAVAAAVILLEEWTDRNEEIERLRKTLLWVEKHSLCCHHNEESGDGHQDDCPVALALDPQRNEVPAMEVTIEEDEVETFARRYNARVRSERRRVT